MVSSGDRPRERRTCRTSSSASRSDLLNLVSSLFIMTEEEEENVARREDAVGRELDFGCNMEHSNVEITAGCVSVIFGGKYFASRTEFSFKC